MTISGPYRLTVPQAWLNYYLLDPLAKYKETTKSMSRLETGEPVNSKELQALVLNNSRDKQRLLLQNSPISAECRGHAIAIELLDKKIRKRITESSEQEKDNESKDARKVRLDHSTVDVDNLNNNRGGNNNKEYGHVSGKKKSRKGKRKTKHRKSKNEMLGNCENNHNCNRKLEVVIPGADFNTELAEDSTTASRTESACSVQDSKVVYVQDGVSDVPAGERLWRFALINRQFKNKSRESLELGIPKLGIPSVRSNQAIYNGLQQKLKETRGEELRNKETNKDVNSDASRSVDSAVVGFSGRRPRRKRNTNAKHVTVHKCQSSSATESIRKSVLINKIKTGGSSFSLADSTVPATKPTTREAQDSLPKLLKENRKVETPTKPEHFRAQPMPKLRPEFENNNSKYDSLLKRRLACRNRLEATDKEIVNTKSNSHPILSRETIRNFFVLKYDFLKLCCQESSLRNQISLLQSEIYTMQTKAFPKKPEVDKTISLDSTSTKLPHGSDTTSTGVLVPPYSKVLLFPPLEASKSLQASHHSSSNEKNGSRSEDISAGHVAGKNIQPNTAPFGAWKTGSGNSHTNLPDLPTEKHAVSHRSVCKLFTFENVLEEPIKRQPDVFLVPEEKCSYRLPKMKSSDIKF